MAGVEVEIDSFVGKFRQLWRAGYDVQFDLNAHAGNAWLGIRLNLGRQQTKSTGEGEFLKKKSSPSRIRRRERRAASRNDAKLSNSENVADILDKDCSSTVEIEKSGSDVFQTVAVAEEAISEPAVNLAINEAPMDETVENSVVEDVPVENTGFETAVDNCLSAGTQVAADEELCADGDVKEDTKIDVVTDDNDTIECEQAKHPIIHATAIVQNSPYQSFNQDEWDSILRFITNKDHLKNM